MVNLLKGLGELNWFLRFSASLTVSHSFLILPVMLSYKIFLFSFFPPMSIPLCSISSVPRPPQRKIEKGMTGGY